MATEPTDERRLKELLFRGCMSRKQKINLYIWLAMGQKQANKTYLSGFSQNPLVLSSKCSRDVFLVTQDVCEWVNQMAPGSPRAHTRSAVRTLWDPAALGAIKMQYACVKCGQNKSVCPCLEAAASPPTWYILPHLSFPQAWNRSGRMMGCLGTAGVAWDLFLCR